MAAREYRRAPGALIRDMPRILPLAVAGIGLAAGAFAQAGSPQLGTEVVWHDNVTNAERPEDVLGAMEWRTEFAFGRRWLLPAGHRLLGSARVRTELWPRFEGLNLLVPGLVGTWEFKPGLGPHRPVFAVEAEVERALAQERGRGGLGGAGRLSVRQRLGTSWLLAAGHEWRRFDARAKAFDRTGREWFGRAEWSLGESWSLALEARRRVGDVVSYSRPPRPDLVAIGKPITFVDTFEQDVPWIAYYFAAETRSGALEATRTLGRATLTLRQEYRHTLHAGPGYKNQLTSLRLAIPF